MVKEVEQGKLYWSPSVKWRKHDDIVKVEIYTYKRPYSEIIPEIYYLSQKGILEKDLISNINMDKKRLKLLLKDLKNKKILIDSILSPTEIFYPQSVLLEHEYGESLLIDNIALEKFREEQINRNYYKNRDDWIQLDSSEEIPEYIYNRRSFRKFNREEKISFSDFSYLCSTYRQIKDTDETRYLYASAGGLYPIDIYFYIKKDRVENLEQGLYYYDPVKNRLTIINKDINIPKEVHYFTNQNIFEESAYSIFYFYNGEVSMPKYGGMGYYYSIIDLGIMIQAYTIMAETKNIAVCSIGEMKFDNIKDLFSLKKNQKYLHTMEVGLKNQ